MADKATTQQPLEEVGEPQPESEEAAWTQQSESLEKKISEPQRPESEEATPIQQPVSSQKANEPQQSESEVATSTQQSVSLEKSNEPQKSESEEAASMATPTQQPGSSEKVSEPQQASESGKEADSLNREGQVTEHEHTPTNVRVAPEVDNCPFCRIVVQLARAYEVYRDHDFVCFEDRSPVSTHHYLLVPRKHYQDLRLVT